MDYPFAIVLLCKFIEQPDGLQVLFESRWLEFWIGSAQVVAFKFGIAIHPAAQQSATDRAVGQDGDSFPRAVGQDVLFDLALEKIVGRLRGVNRSDQAEFIQ